MTTHFDDRTLAALIRLATLDEISVLRCLLDDISAGRPVPPYAACYIADILGRLARSESNTLNVPERPCHA